LRRTSAAIGAAVAAPSIVPAAVLGRRGLVPPSERVTMGFIGVGGQGGGHLLGGAWTYVTGGYAGRKDVQVLAVCDVRQERREGRTQQVNDNYAAAYGKGSYKSCEAYTDFRQVLERDDIDAVLSATPAPWHATMAEEFPGPAASGRRNRFPPVSTGTCISGRRRGCPTTASSPRIASTSANSIGASIITTSFNGPRGWTIPDRSRRSWWKAARAT